MKCLVRIGKMVFPIRYEQQVSTSPPAVFLLHLSLSYATLSTYESIKFFAFLVQQALMTEIMKKIFWYAVKTCTFFYRLLPWHALIVYKLQLNQNSHFLDLSQVYGSKGKDAMALRTMKVPTPFPAFISRVS